MTDPIREGIISIDDPAAPDVRALLAGHLALMFERSPPEDVHALDVEGLLEPSVTFFSFRLQGKLLGVGALKRLDRHHAEVKSMHTLAEARRRGIGRAMLDHLIEFAHNQGVSWISLETGTQDGFTAARSLYAERGFVSCGPFDGYVESPSSAFMTLSLEHEAR
jgi:putative acetyltransferase